MTKVIAALAFCGLLWGCTSSDSIECAGEVVELGGEMVCLNERPDWATGLSATSYHTHTTTATSLTNCNSKATTHCTQANHPTGYFSEPKCSAYQNCSGATCPVGSYCSTGSQCKYTCMVAY